MSPEGCDVWAPQFSSDDRQGWGRVGELDKQTKNIKIKNITRFWVFCALFSVKNEWITNIFSPIKAYLLGGFYLRSIFYLKWSGRRRTIVNILAMPTVWNWKHNISNKYIELWSMLNITLYCFLIKHRLLEIMAGIQCSIPKKGFCSKGLIRRRWFWEGQTDFHTISANLPSQQKVAGRPKLIGPRIFCSTFPLDFQ